MLKKLISLNLALIMMCTLVPFQVFAIDMDVDDESIAANSTLPEKYIVIAGEIFDITTEPKSDSWEVYYNSNWEMMQLELTDYNAGPIVCNVNLMITATGVNTVVGEGGNGIKVYGDLSLVTEGGSGDIAVYGAEGYSAIFVEGKLKVYNMHSADGKITAVGGNVGALESQEFESFLIWPVRITIGSSEEETVSNEYISNYREAFSYDGENYVHIENLPYCLTLDGNGGVSDEGEDTVTIIHTAGTPGYLFLYPYRDVFSYENKILLGWDEVTNSHETVFHELGENFKFPTGKLEAKLFARWEDEHNKAVFLENYYGQLGAASDYYGTTKTVAVTVGEFYTLPESIKAGTKMLGWRGEDDELYPVGTEIEITDTCTFTAEYETLYLEVDGVLYDATENHGSYAKGWHYNATSPVAQMSVYDYYKGGSIVVPSDARISIRKAIVVGDDDKPAITVMGNAELRFSGQISGQECTQQSELIGGEGAPAVLIDGDLKIVSVFLEAGEWACLSSGAEKMPALMVSGSIDWNDSPFYTGTDKENLQYVEEYKNEEVLKFISEDDVPLETSGILLTIDGETYDVAAEPSGKGWSVYYYGEEQSPELSLNNYKGSSIVCTGDLEISASGTNIITADDSNGIYVMGDLSTGYSSRLIELKVIGAEGYSAIRADGEMRIDIPFTAVGGGTAALEALSIKCSTSRPVKLYAGTDEKHIDRTETYFHNDLYASLVYNGEEYIHLEKLVYSLTLNGGGGITEGGENEIVISHTSGLCSLSTYKNSFTNDYRAFLGWKEQRDGQVAFYEADKYYEFADNCVEAFLIAQWEDETNKAIFLENYYAHGTGLEYDYNGETRTIAVIVGEMFILPESIKGGAKMLGWRGEDGELYPVGAEIQITDTCTFTAEYETLYLEIDGTLYDATEDHGSYKEGWHYFNSSPVPQLNVYNNYSGKPIAVPGSVRLNLFKSMIGEEDQPAIIVDGDLNIHVYDWKGKTDYPVRLVGGGNVPAIKASGKVEISVSGDTMMFIVASGGEGIPAIQGTEVINTHRVFWAGNDADNLSLVANYSGEEYAEFTDTWQYTITLEGDAVVPDVPVHNSYSFVGWFEVTDEYVTSGLRKWFMPGDVVDAGDGMKLEARYVDNNGRSTAIIVDGQGQETAFGSKYFVHFVSSDVLHLYELPECPFVGEDYEFAEYNTASDGTGVSYYPGDSLTTDKFVWKLYVQGNVIHDVSMAEGVSLRISPNNSIVQLSVSKDWCIEHGLNQVIAAMYDGDRLLNCSLEYFDGTTDLSLEMEYPENCKPEVKIFAMDEKLSPVYQALSCELSDYIK